MFHHPSLLRLYFYIFFIVIISCRPINDAVQRGRRLQEAEGPVLVQGGERGAAHRTGMGAAAGAPLPAPAEAPAIAGAAAAAAEAAAGAAGQAAEGQGGAGAAGTGAARNSFRP